VGDSVAPIEKYREQSGEHGEHAEVDADRSLAAILTELPVNQRLEGTPSFCNVQ
jgi:hypothetical protein